MPRHRLSWPVATTVVSGSVVVAVLPFLPSGTLTTRSLAFGLLVLVIAAVTDRFAARLSIGELNQNFVASEFALIAGLVFVEPRLHLVTRMLGTAIGTGLRVRKSQGKFLAMPSIFNAGTSATEVVVATLLIGSFTGATRHHPIVLAAGWLAATISHSSVISAGHFVAGTGMKMLDRHFARDLVLLSAPTVGVAIAVISPGPVSFRIIVGLAACGFAFQFKTWTSVALKASNDRGYDAFFEVLAETNEVESALKVASAATKFRTISVVVWADHDDADSVSVISAEKTVTLRTAELPASWTRVLEHGDFLNEPNEIVCPLMVGGRRVGLLVCADPFDRKHVSDEGTVRRLAHHLSLWLELRADLDARTHQALHDPLTGLLNKRGIQESWDAIRGTHDQIAVFLIDLDGFKQINAHIGHQGGDHALVEAARRLKLAFPPRAILGRLGGDEFAVIVPGMRTTTSTTTASHDAGSLARQIRHAVTAPFTHLNRTIELSGTIGVAMSPEHGDDLSTLLRNADLALFQAKDDGENGVAVYATSLNPDSIDGYSLKAAIDNNEIEVWFQPIVNVQTHRIAGFEALARWNRPTGWVQPAQFVGLAEETGHIHALTERVTREAVAQISRWRELTGLDLHVGVNFSPLCISNPSTVKMITSALASAKIPASALHIEVTEGRMFSDPLRATVHLNNIRACGVHIALDDFGTGASTMQWIVQMAPNGLKIDKSFVQAMDKNPLTVSVIKVDVMLGKDHGMTVIAEGVETAEQWNRLAELGVEYAQGFLIARPKPASEIRRWLLEDEPYIAELIALASSLERSSESF